MIRIVFGQAANRRRGDKDQPRRSADTVTAFILHSVKAPRAYDPFSAAGC